MASLQALKSRVLSVDGHSFDALVLDIFRFQALHCSLYAAYLALLKINPASVNKVEQIPFLPIQLFKNHRIQTGHWQPETIFESSGTTGIITSKHLVQDVTYYHQVALQIFEREFGKIENYHILAPLPSYLERPNSSLINMLAHFMTASSSQYSQFYQNNYSDLYQNLQEILLNKTDGRQILLWGVGYALLDFLELKPVLPQNTERLLLLETGGMKGRRAEMSKEALHVILCQGFSVPKIYSEYGMTELLSQAYSHGHGVFSCSASMKVVLREVTDPRQLLPPDSRRTGGINVIDLANVATCSFIETQDLGQMLGEGTFKVMGRFDNADLRGCNLLMQ